MTLCGRCYRGKVFSEKKVESDRPKLVTRASALHVKWVRFFPSATSREMMSPPCYNQHEAMGYSAPLTGHINEPGKEFAYSSGDINTASNECGNSPLVVSRIPIGWAHNFIAPLGLHKMVLEPDAKRSTGRLQAMPILPPVIGALMGQLWLDAWHGRRSR